MKRMLALAASIAAFGAFGCAGQKPMPASTKPQAQSAAMGQGTASYVVHKGDSLWAIAGKSDVLGDPFRWPLLFKANRDQIVDPDFIQPDQDLSYRTDYSSDEIADAVKKAEATPAYQRHKRPRKVLPIQY
ncbi:MAG: LysM peptidoglycan-binding domain-containing protein [bacterium]